MKTATNNVNPIPQFKTKMFQNEREFKKWLTKTAYQVITFKDLGQDMQSIYVHSTGEILHCDFHSALYAGKFINTEHVKIDQEIEIWDDEKTAFIPYRKLIVEQINII